MKNGLCWWVAAWLSISAPGCIFVHVRGDLDEELFDDEDGGFMALRTALEGCLTEPEYDLALQASPWGTEAEWTVTYVEAGSDVHAAFRNARDAVIQRVSEEGGTLTSQRNEGPHAWSCNFQLDGSPGSASVKLVEDEGEDALEVVWKETD